MFSAGRSFRFLFAFVLWSGVQGCSVWGQIHEEKPAPGLDQGVLIRYEKDSAAPAAINTNKRIGIGDFSVVCQITLPKEVSKISAPVTLVSGADGVSSSAPQAEWKLLLNPDRSLSFTAQAKESDASVNISSLKDALVAGKTHDVIVSVHRDARQPQSGIWVDGIELVSGTFGLLDLQASLPRGEWNASHLVNSVALYDRALTRPEIVDLTLRHTSAVADRPKAKHPEVLPNGPRFIPQQDETIALLGGTEAMALAESGELEALLLAAFPQTRFHFRNLAWEGDTVFRQDRPMNFGDLPQQLLRVNAGAVFIMFGRQECLDRGNEGVNDFKIALEKLIATVRGQTPNIVLLGVPPFESKSPPLPNLAAFNGDLKGYADVLREIAERKRLVFVDPAAEFPNNGKGYGETRDGISLTQKGCADLAFALAKGLQISVTRSASDLNPQLGTSPQAGNPLLAGIHAKNHLWHDYWRPSNWAFLYGDRTNQPSSRDPVNAQIRLFPSEQETILPMLKAAEEKVYRTAEEMQKRLP